MREFLALPLPEALRRRLGALPAELGLSRKDWRIAREEGLHVTVRFLGDVDPSRHAHLDAAWRTAAAGTGPLALEVAGLSFAGTAKRPRVAWLDVRGAGGEALADLAGRVEQAARAEGFPPETRPFAAHVTLARARGGFRARGIAGRALPGLGPFSAERLVLYGSRLGPAGAVYEELASYPLVPGAAA